MMAETHRDPEAMARCLVTYIADDRRVQSAIASEFASAPPLKMIAQLRVMHERNFALSHRGRNATGFNAMGWDWRGEKHASAMERASNKFIQAIERERSAA